MRDTERIRKLPSYALGRVRAQMKEERAKGADVIDLGMGNPDGPTPPHIVNKLKEVINDRKTHRYSVSRGLPNLRKAIAQRYAEDLGVELDPEREAIAVIGAKEGIAHLALALLDDGDYALVPTPTYPIHMYSVVIAGGRMINVPLTKEEGFVLNLDRASKLAGKKKPKIMIISYPQNPTTATVDLPFFEKVVAFAKAHKIIVVHDFAYKDSTFDDYKAPSFLQAKGAKDVGVELFSLSKSYNMPGWRVGFVLGNAKVVENLAKLKSYTDYGIFTPIQVAAITALKSDQACKGEIMRIYQNRRDCLIDGLAKAGWKIEKPSATMFVWAQLPEKYKQMTSMDFSMMLMKKAAVAVAPGTGFGDSGEGFVRFALVENENRIKQALRSIKKIL